MIQIYKYNSLLECLTNSFDAKTGFVQLMCIINQAKYFIMTLTLKWLIVEGLKTIKGVEMIYMLG